MTGKLSTEQNQRLSLFYGISGGYQHFINNTCAWGFEHVFHFHGLEYQKGVAFFHFVARLRHEAEDEAGHGGFELVHLAFGPAVDAHFFQHQIEFCTQAAFEGLFVYQNAAIGAIHMLPLYGIALAVDEQVQAVVVDAHQVGVNRFAIDGKGIALLLDEVFFALQLYFKHVGKELMSCQS